MELQCLLHLSPLGRKHSAGRPYWPRGSILHMFVDCSNPCTALSGVTAAKGSKQVQIVKHTSLPLGPYELADLAYHSKGIRNEKRCCVASMAILSVNITAQSLGSRTRPCHMQQRIINLLINSSRHDTQPWLRQSTEP